MTQHLTLRVPIDVRRRRLVVAVASFAVLAIGVGVATVALTSEAPDPTVQRAAPLTSPPPSNMRLCGNDVANLLGAITAMPTDVQAQLLGRLSPDLANGLGAVALSTSSGTGLPSPEVETLGGVLSRLDRNDAMAITNSMPIATRQAVADAEQAAWVVFFESGERTVCS